MIVATDIYFLPLKPKLEVFQSVVIAKNDIQPLFKLDPLMETNNLFIEEDVMFIS